LPWFPWPCCESELCEELEVAFWLAEDDPDPDDPLSELAGDEPSPLSPPLSEVCWPLMLLKEFRTKATINK
jgi:hypothetical protein